MKFTGRWITTRPMRAEDGDAVFTVDLDFVDHRLLVHATTGRTSSFSLPGHSVASFHVAVLRYDDARATEDPRAAVLDFYESAYVAGAGRAGWDIDQLRAPGGRTTG